MKRILKIFFVRLLYRCEIKENYFSEKRKETRWTFKMYPRKIPVTILNICLIPFVFIVYGYKGVSESLGDIYKVQSWSSYELWSISQPSKSECYSRF